MRPSTKLLITSNILLISVLVWLLLKENYLSKICTKFSDKNNSYQKKITYSFNRDALFESLPNDTNAIVFLGTSLTEHYELSEYFPHANVKNRGITGDVTKGVLKRLNPITQLKPKKIFIEIGINDVFTQFPNDSILQNYYAIIDTLIQNCPDTEIYVQSLFPISNDKRLLPNYDTKEINKNIVNLNKLLGAHIVRKRNANLFYIDTHQKFKLDNELNAMYTIDGVHLSAKGYAAWTIILQPFVEK